MSCPTRGFLQFKLNGVDTENKAENSLDALHSGQATLNFLSLGYCPLQFKLNGSDTENKEENSLDALHSGQATLNFLY